MKKRDVIEFFRDAQHTAKVLGISHQAVYRWPPDDIPRSAERRVRKALRDFLAKAGPAR